MKKKSLWVVKLLSGILAMLGLGSCATKQAPVDNVDQPVQEVDPREDIGRVVVLYGGPPAKYVEKYIEPEKEIIKKEAPEQNK